MGGHFVKKKKVVFALRSERKLKRLDYLVSYGEPANRRSGKSKWELIPID